VQILNVEKAADDKMSGALLLGPTRIHNSWSGFNGDCAHGDGSDPVVLYDKSAQRLVVGQMNVTLTAYCMAVFTTSDATQSYYRYEFSFGSNTPDYPKLAVWPNAYYWTANTFSGANTFLGANPCAFDRATMLSGGPANAICMQQNPSVDSLLPADLDGTTPPPAGEPNFYLQMVAPSNLNLLKFHVDFTTPSNSTFTGPTAIPVASFSEACGGGTCIPQPGTTQQLDSLGDRLMFRLAYRNLGDHESLVVNHSVTAGSSVGVRWYELRTPAGTPTVFQQGTYAPDAAYRWMGSIAMDHNGDIALGYSTSSSTLKPGIRYTGRLAGDAPGVLQSESTILTGGGAQTGNLSRWGDYTSLSVDPSDDCTFWYTNQYLASNGSFNWHTRIASFKFSGCGGTPPPSDFSISANPPSVSIVQGGSGTSTISTAVTSGSAQTVALTATGQPAGTTVSFSPVSLTAGGSSTMTVSVGAATTPGTYTITVTGTGSSATHTTTVTLTVTAAPPSDFSIGANPASVSIAQGGSGTSTIS